MYAFTTVLYNVFLHPLAKYPGPLLWHASRLNWSHSIVTGQIHNRHRALHERYGPVVRVAPNELSFIDPAAWNDIHAHTNNRKFRKDPAAYRKGPNVAVDHILIAGDSDHARYRRCLSHAFSDKALREQAELVEGHVDLLVKRLKEEPGKHRDLVKWYNFATFDIIGKASTSSSGTDGAYTWASDLSLLTLLTIRRPRFRVTIRLPRNFWLSSMGCSRLRVHQSQWNYWDSATLHTHTSPHGDRAGLGITEDRGPPRHDAG